MATIGYEETCIAMERVLGIPARASTGAPLRWTRATEMDPGDEALVFRIALGPHERRTATRGNVGVDFLAEHCELGLLRRTR